MIVFFFFIFDDETGTTVPVPVEEQDVDNVEELEFFNDGVRKVWHKKEEEWYFSIVDVVGVLTEQPDTRHAAKYWSVLKTRLKKEGSQLSQLKLKAADGW